MKRLLSIVFMMLYLVSICTCAMAEDEAKYSYQGTAWGMTRDEVRMLAGVKPLQEPVAPTGHSALVYQMRNGTSFIMVQYNFLPSGALYNIEIMAPDEDGAFYAAHRDEYTAQYGEALTAADASMESENAVSVMMASLMQTTSDEDFLGWQADDETVIIMSTDPAYHVCYIEIRRYTDYFTFE